MSSKIVNPKAVAASAVNRPRGGAKAAPGPTRTPGYLNMLLRQRDPPRFYLELARRFGDVAYFKFGPIHSYLVSHPDLVREVFVTQSKKFGRPIGAKILRKMMLGNGLLTSEGDFHLRQRRMMQPAFHRQRVAGYAKVMVEYAELTSQRWAARNADAPVDMAQEMMHLTLAVVGKTLLDADVERDAPEVGAAMDTMIELFDRSSSPLHILLGRLKLLNDKAFWAGRQVLDDVIYRIIEERRAKPGDRGDLLSMLLMAADDEDASYRMSNEQVRDEAMTLFLAGHETTALALTWAWYLISQHPEVERRLHEEVDAVLGDRAASFDDLAKLKYTEMIVSETLRLYPPAWLLARSTLSDTEVGGFHLPARSMVVVSPWVMHRDPRFFPDPMTFKPERWTPEFKDGLPKLAFLPFGGGNRVCIGEGFAWAEAILLLATLARRWRAELVAGQTVQAKAMITLRPKFGLPMHLRKRC